MLLNTAKMLAIALGLSAGSVAVAASDHAHHAPAHPSAQSSTQAYQASARRMRENMDIRYSGDADIDFAKGMIPHHQAAVDMAKIQLQFGKDPELRKLSEEIIRAQEKEIAFLQGWIETREARSR